jgi:hypothetical protein
MAARLLKARATEAYEMIEPEELRHLRELLRDKWHRRAATAKDRPTGIQSFAFEPCDDEGSAASGVRRRDLASVDAWITIWSGLVMGGGIALVALKLLGLAR